MWIWIREPTEWCVVLKNDIQIEGKQMVKNYLSTSWKKQQDQKFNSLPVTQQIFAIVYNFAPPSQKWFC